MDQRRQSFPQELVQKVLDELVERNEVGALSKDAEGNLKQCALVNWAFLSSSQRRLFNHVTLPSDKHYLSISHTLRNSPHIAGLIQSLHIDCKDDLSVEGTLFPEVSNPGLISVSEIAQYEALLQCRNLTLLFMENNLERPLALEFYGRLLALPVLKRVCLAKMHSFPIRILRGCVALESLSLKGCLGVDFPVETQQNQGAGLPWMVPREIALSGFVLGVDGRRLNEFVRWSLSPASFLKFHNLKRLAAIPILMFISKNTAEPVQDLINVTRNLEYLLLDSDYRKFNFSRMCPSPAVLTAAVPTFFFFTSRLFARLHTVDSSSTPQARPFRYRE
jgi:hypothetical protein